MIKNVVFNAESSYYYFVSDEFRRSIVGATNLYCDSVSLSIVLFIRGIRYKRIHGPDLMHSYLDSRAISTFMIIGGSQTAHMNIVKRYKLNNCFCYDGVINYSEGSDFVKLVQSIKPDVIFVCLGLRKQEHFADIIWRSIKNCNYQKNTVIIGVGAAIDFLGGTKVRAGLRWRNHGLEWLPRLLREPRMLPRIFRSFLGCIIALLYIKRNLETDELKFATKL